MLCVMKLPVILGGASKSFLNFFNTSYNRFKSSTVSIESVVQRLKCSFPYLSSKISIPSFEREPCNPQSSDSINMYF